MSDTTTSMTSNGRQFKRNPNTTQKFYMIYRGNLTHGRHSTFKIAQKEAKLISKEHPGSKVFILETVSCYLCSVSEPESVELEEL